MAGETLLAEKSNTDTLLQHAAERFLSRKKIEDEETRPNSWAKQVREIERGHWILDFMIYEMKNGEGKV